MARWRHVLVALGTLCAARELEAASRPKRNARCEACHEEIAEEWRASRHHVAFTNEEFQRSLKREANQPFCIDCHAPETTKSGAPTPEEGAIGVACVTCHLEQHTVLASTGDAQAPHPLKRDAKFASADTCKRCHEFRFAAPRAAPPDDRAQWMQRTWTEHHDGNLDGANASCSGCHMPRRDGHVSHLFPGGYDVALVRSALEIEAERTPRGVKVQLTPRSVTHAVPTGDLFRRLLVTVDTVPSQGRPIARYLARHYRPSGAAGERLEVADDRVMARSTTLELEAGEQATGRPLQFRVVYQRVDHLQGDDEANAVVAGEIELARGELPDLSVPAVSSQRAGRGGCSLGAEEPRGWAVACWGLAVLSGFRRLARRARAVH